MFARLKGLDKRIRAGEYLLNSNMTPTQMLEIFISGKVMLHRVTVPEGFTQQQIAVLLEQSGLVSEQAFIEAAQDTHLRNQLNIAVDSFEGYLFPDTYFFPRGVSAKKIISTMVNRFWTQFGADWKKRADELGMSVHEVITLASIIEKEAIFDDEKPKIASVIYNRLEKNIAFQCDVTIRYPLDNYGTHLTHDDLKMESPYNSYLHTGIPPTPICSPGLPAIGAALNPAQTDYMYFVSMNNGRHKFSPTLNEHNKAVYRYQILNERG